MRRILFCGSDSFSSTILARLTQSVPPATTFLTLIPPSSHTGRGLKKLYRPPLLELVEQLGIAHQSLPRSENPLIRRNPLKDWSLPEELKSPDSILLSASFPYWIPSELITQFAPLRALNVHPSLLPCYRGAAPIQWQLANQEPELGVSIQELSSVGFDRGVILAQKSLRLPPATCYPAAEHALANLAADLLLHLIPNIDTYINSAWPQDPAKASYAPKIVPLDLRIDPSWSYAKVAGRSRGMSHQYPLNIQINGEIYQIEVDLPDSPLAARFAAQNGARLSGALPGELLFDRALDRVALRLGPATSSGDCEPPLLINNAKLVRAGGKGWLKPAAWWDRLFNTSPCSPKSLKTFRVSIDPTSQ